MKIRWTIIFAAFLVAAAPAWATCQYKGSDITGASSCYSPQAEARLREVPFNIMDLPKAEISSIKEQLRDNSITHWQIGLNEVDGTESWVLVQQANFAFSIQSVQHIVNPERSDQTHQALERHHRECP